MKQENASELFDLAGAVCDEIATQRQLARLQEILDDCSESQQWYANYMLLHAELFWQQESILDSPVRRNMGLSIAPVVGQPNIFKWFLSLTAMLFVGSAIGIGIARFFQDSENPSNVAQIVAQKKSGDVVAVVSGTRNCRWSSADEDSAEQQPLSIGYGSKIFAGQKLDLTEGLAEITFNTGVRVIIEAPVKFDLSSIDKSVLHTGRLTASVPKGAEGFQVACRGITLVDRGTEFGVSAGETGETEVRVFDGLVEGHVKDSRGFTLEKISWTTNDSVLFNASTNEFRDVTEPSLFVRSLSQSTNLEKGLVAAEDFDYPVGPLGGQNGGFGWGGPWQNISVAEESPESNGVGLGSVPFEGLDHLGNHALLNGQFNRIRRILGTSFSGVFDTAGLVENQDGARLIGRDGTSIYLSFTQRVSKTNDVFYGFELNRGDGNSNRVLCVGHGAARAWNQGPPRSPDKDAGVTGWSVTSEFNGTQNRLREIGRLGEESNEPVFLVMKITFGQHNQDEVRVFVNPAAYAQEEDCEPIVVGEGNFAFDRIGIANFEGEKIYEVDHIRIGTIFSAVVQFRNVPDFASHLKND